MTRNNCNTSSKIIQEMGWYLGIDLDIPKCSLNKCPKNGCGRKEKMLKELTNKLLSIETTDEHREKVRKKHCKRRIYSFFESDEIQISNSN